MLDLNFLKDALKEFDIVYFDKIDSTNSEAKRNIISGFREKRLYIASCQTDGRGRMGRSFYSPPKTGIYLSFAFPAPEIVNDVVSLTSKSAVAVTEAIESLTDIALKIKWVNDIYLAGKKICGILSESIVTDRNYIIIGIGINLSTNSFPDEIASSAGSLNCDSLSETELIYKIAKNMLFFINNPHDKSYLKSYRSHSLVLGKEIYYIKNKESFQGTVTLINDDASLTVLKNDGKEDILSSGEITLRLKK